MGKRDDIAYAYANSNGSDEPAHPHSLVRTVAVRLRKW